MSAAALAPRRENLPDGSVRIWFAAPILFHAEPKGSCVFHPPNVGDWIDIGDPRSFVYNDEGVGTPYTDRATLRQWAKKLIEGHDFEVIARESDMRLAILIEDVLLGFFRNARNWLNAESAPSPQ